jgi:hypothetical protein
MARLAEGVLVRKESWGLLFYVSSRHKVFFVRSGDWLEPRHFDGTWTQEDMATDIARCTGAPAEVIERALPRLIARLAASRMVANEVR